MKYLLPLTLCFTFFIYSCSALPVKANRYYSEREFKMIEDTTKSLEMGFGFESRLDINYFFHIDQKSFIDTNPDKAVQNEEDSTAVDVTEEEVESFAKAMAAYSDKEQYYYYLKVYSLYSSHTYLRDFFKKERKWREYNTMRIDLYPGVEHYMMVFDSYFQKHKPTLYTDLEAQKEDVRVEAILYNQKKYTIVDEYN